MNESNGRYRSGNPCDAGCQQCEVGEENENRGLSGPTLQGWRLALGASGIFGIPLILAIVGAIVGGDRQVYQLMGAIAGFAIGVVVSGVIVRLICPADEEGVHDGDNDKAGGKGYLCPRGASSWS